MNILCASDSFKGTLTSDQTIDLLSRAAKEVFGPDTQISGVPVADGGEGTTQAVVKARGGSLVDVRVHGPLMEEETAFYGRIGEDEAVMEMAAASGLPMVPRDLRDPRKTTTKGTGELLKAILDAGIRKVSIAIGGSATNDGGMGFASALGVRFLDKNGQVLEGRGEDLARVADSDVSGLDPKVSDARFTVMCDVTNPLTGPHGATYTFGPQKGGTPQILDQLEAGMENYRQVIIRKFGIDPNGTQGTGAAGGLGAALLIFCHAQMKSGIETVLDLIDFDARLTNVDLVVTGEGRTDWQSAFGKVLQGVGERSAAHGIPAVALSGSLGKDYEDIYQHGIESLMTTVDGPMSLEEALDRAQELYYKGAVRTFRMIRAGMQIGQ